MSRPEQIVCGQHAVLAALQHRARDVRRLYFAPSHLAALRPVLRELAARRAVYREVSDAELERVAQSRAHQGLCAVLDAPETETVRLDDLHDWAAAPGVTLALDGVGNPHNLGAIARTAAFLGAGAILLSAEGVACVRSTSAYRTAQGGLETLPAYRSEHLASDIRTFRAAGGRVCALALALGGKQRLGDIAGLGRAAPGVLLVAGSEEHGISAEVASACGSALRIEGSLAIDSLNVGVAVGIALSWLLEASGSPRGPR